MQTRFAIPALAMTGALLITSACARRPRPAIDVPPPVSTVIFIREMEPLPGVTEMPVTVTAGVQSIFDTSWPGASGEVTAVTTPEALAGISSWARPLMTSYVLPEDWIARMPMTPIGATDQGQVVFGQTAEKSPIELPSQTTLVHRRLIVAAVVDPATHNIPRVYVTIRGWAEE